MHNRIQEVSKAAMPEAAQEHVEPKLTFPNEEGALVAEEYARADRILEYGSGGSTILAARSTRAKVLSIESDREWAENLKAVLGDIGTDPERVIVHWSDIGPTGKWGYPVDQRNWRKYPAYAFCPWEDFDFSPDLVLIDGRFRLACLAATCLHAKKLTTVLFDDYKNRAVYHAAERLLTPNTIVGRMAKFEIEPGAIDKSQFAAMVRWFFIPR